MQKLDKRNTYTPTDISQVRSNCGLVLKALKGRGSVLSLKTLSNNSDANLTVIGQAGQDSRVLAVYVQNKRRKPLMPTTPRKAKILLNNGMARVIKRAPFTIQMMRATGETKQNITLGVDSGYEIIGLSAITNKKELYTAEVKLRADIVKLNSKRRIYRKTRRNRKTWHRKTRFLNRKKPKGWLAPSLQHKLDSHIKVIQRVARILPINKVILEVASFDIQKIKNLNIRGKEYQEGVQKDFWNVREYVLHRDGHKCQCCKGKSKDNVLNVHHIKSRKIESNRPDNLITLCKTCHEEYHKGNIDLKINKSYGFKPETFMSTIRWRLINTLKKLFSNVGHTYGHITKLNRIKLGISKSHSNDAFVIAGGEIQQRSVKYFIKQIRNCNRKLFKGARSHIRNTAPTFVHGFKRFDKVLFKGIECFIFGRRIRGYFDVRGLDGTKINSSAKLTDISLLESSTTLLTQMEVCKWI